MGSKGKPRAKVTGVWTAMAVGRGIAGLAPRVIMEVFGPNLPNQSTSAQDQMFFSAVRVHTYVCSITLDCTG